MVFDLSFKYGKHLFAGTNTHPYNVTLERKEEDFVFHRVKRRTDTEKGFSNTLQKLRKSLESRTGKAIIGDTLTIGVLTTFAGYQFLLLWPMIAIGWVISLAQRGVAGGSARDLDPVRTVDGGVELACYREGGKLLGGKYLEAIDEALDAWYRADRAGRAARARARTGRARRDRTARGVECR